MLLISIVSYSQEFDESYLASLPETVREDLEKKMEAQEALEEPIYRRASTFVDKEKEDDDDFTSSLFGADFFDVMQTSFMPINEPNLDSLYILDFGDILEIQLVGQKDSIDEYAISRDGSTFTTATLSDSGYVTGSSGQRILTGTATISGQPSGQSMRWKLALANNAVKIHGVALQWS